MRQVVSLSSVTL